MATLERIEPAYVPWKRSASAITAEDEKYIGRHRTPDTGRRFSLMRMFHLARHRRH
jgi:ribosomal protein S14